MKKIVMLIVAVAAFSLVPIHNANADHGSPRRIVGYTSCGEPIFSVYHIHGYDHCGRPVGHWVTQYPSSHRESREYRPVYRQPIRPSHGHCAPSRPSWGFSIRF